MPFNILTMQCDVCHNRYRAAVCTFRCGRIDHQKSGVLHRCYACQLAGLPEDKRAEFIREKSSLFRVANRLAEPMPTALQGSG